MKTNSAFTLAEVMITLTVIGIITAIILPVALHSVPDNDVMKFKKGNNTLYHVIRELINSEKYYLDGDLGIMTDGQLVNGLNEESIKYFCKTFADNVTTKKVNCSTIRNDRKTAFIHTEDGKTISKNSDPAIKEKLAAEVLDSFCSENTNTGEEIVTTDGIVFYQTSPYHTFGINNNDSSLDDEVDFAGGTNDKRLFGQIGAHDSEKFDTMYKVFCMDIDGIKKGTEPFGYGIRADGKIFYGKRANEWTSKSIQKEN